MVIRGRIENGVVVFQPGVSLPDGTEVSVVVGDAAKGAVHKMTEEQRRHLREALKHFESLPDENPGDAFRAADHDQVLYGS
jgi:predicted DNA-binding antitoxin AbrB/MazE fold protein